MDYPRGNDASHATSQWDYQMGPFTTGKSSSAIGKTYRSLTKDYDYTLRLTLEEPPQEEQNKAKVAIEVGWRLFETGLRVAVALGEDGDLRELYLPKQWLDGKRKAESLGSIIDRGTNQTALA